MNERKTAQVADLKRYADLIQKQTGRVVRPYRADGFVNMMNKYGTARDVSEHYEYVPEPMVEDTLLSTYYEGNGLFAKIIDAPAEEAIKHGFHLEGLQDQKLEDLYTQALDDLDWEEQAMTAIKWARLFGGSIIVVMADDGRGLEEPLNWNDIRSVDYLKVFDRSMITPDYGSINAYNPYDPFGTRGARLGMPEYYTVSSRFGTFRVHDSRCLVFQNGILPENTSNTNYQLWGIPEYIRLKRSLRDAEIANGSASKLLDRAVQAVYKMRDLSSELSTDEGESMVLRRLQIIDMARGLLNSIVIDAEGEDYDFRQFNFSGVTDVINSTRGFLSGLTSIPQSILFGNGVGGMSSTDDSSMENWYSYVERIQKRMIRSNLRYLLSMIFFSAAARKQIDELPPIKVEFEPLWSLSELEQAQLEQTKAATQQTKAATTQIYVGMQAIDPTEVRHQLAQSEEYDIEEMLDDTPDEDLFADGEGPHPPQPQQQGAEGMGGAMPGMPGQEQPGAEQTQPQPEAQPEEKQPEGQAEESSPKLPTRPGIEEPDKKDHLYTDGDTRETVAVYPVTQEGVLVGDRGDKRGICSPGGHVQDGETYAQAAIRETQEEFGITPMELIPFGQTSNGTHLFLCLSYDGEPKCDDYEMFNPRFVRFEDLIADPDKLLPGFKEGIELLRDKAFENVESFQSNMEKPIDFQENYANVKSRELNTDFGVEGMKWGEHHASNKKKNGKRTGYKLSDEQRKKMEKRFVGTVSSQGVTIKQISPHAFDRVGQRTISAGRIQKMLESGNVKPDKKYPDRTVYDIPGSRLILAQDGTIVSVMWREQNK